MNTLIAIIIIFGVLVAVHELGHLYFAKKAGILCREFAIGFGPKVFSTKKNETVYTIRLLPLGGFVRMAGEDPEMVQIKPGYKIGLLFNDAGKVSEIVVNNKSKYPDAKIVSVERIDLEEQLKIDAYTDDEEGLVTYEVDEKCDLIVDEKREQIAPLERQFQTKKPWQKALTIFAGPLMNFVLAFILLLVFGLFNGVPQDDAVIGELTENSPAMEAGLQKGDEVIAINGEPIANWEEMTLLIRSHPNEEMIFDIVRGGESLSLAVTTASRYDEFAETDVGQIGVVRNIEHSPIQAVMYAGEEVYRVSMLIFDVLGLIITGEFSLDYLAGPVGIYNYTGEAAALGMAVLIQWTAMLSVNLGIVNLLPLPALDGGRLLFIFAEAIRGKPVDPEKESMVHFIGFALLFILMLVVTWNDINKFFM